MKGIGVLPGPRLSFVDHLVPLCQMLQLPLFCTDRLIKELIELYYPPMTLHCENPMDYSLTIPLQEYDFFIYSCFHRLPHGAFQFYEYHYQGKARGICSLHGYSDKKRNIYWVERFADEEIALLYGPSMQEFIAEKKAEKRLKKALHCGNYRLEFYRAHKEFFDKKIKCFLFPNGKKNILYAPTWSASDRKSDWRFDYSSFFEAHQAIFHVPKEFNLYVKLHPYFLSCFPSEVEEIKQKYQEKENLHFLDDLPLIYPLLEKMDIYLGDYSSVGYDFLAFNRPLFFINYDKREPEGDKGFSLFSAGRSIFPEDLSGLYSILDQKDLYEEKRREIYQRAFGAQKNLTTLKQDILEALACTK